MTSEPFTIEILSDSKSDVNTFYLLKIRSSLLFYGLLSTIIKCYDPIIDEELIVEENNYSELSNSILKEQIHNVNERNDIPLACICEYTCWIDEQWIEILISTLKDLDETGFNDIIEVFLQLLNHRSIEHSILKGLLMHDENEYSKPKDYHSSYTENRLVNIGILTTVIPAHLGNLVCSEMGISFTKSNQMFDLTKKLGYTSMLTNDLGTRFSYRFTSSRDNIMSFLNYHLCYLMNIPFDSSWEPVFKPILQKIPFSEYPKRLACNLKDCPYESNTCPVVTGEFKESISDNIILQNWNKIYKQGWIKKS